MRQRSKDRIFVLVVLPIAVVGALYLRSQTKREDAYSACTVACVERLGLVAEFNWTYTIENGKIACSCVTEPFYIYLPESDN